MLQLYNIKNIKRNPHVPTVLLSTDVPVPNFTSLDVHETQRSLYSSQLRIASEGNFSSAKSLPVLVIVDSVLPLVPILIT